MPASYMFIQGHNRWCGFNLLSTAGTLGLHQHAQSATQDPSAKGGMDMPESATRSGAVHASLYHASLRQTHIWCSNQTHPSDKKETAARSSQPPTSQETKTISDQIQATHPTPLFHRRVYPQNMSDLRDVIHQGCTRR